MDYWDRQTSEIVRSIFGLDKLDSGEIYMEREKIQIHQPLDAIERASVLLLKTVGKKAL